MPVSGVTTGDPITEAWGDSVAAAVTSLEAFVAGAGYYRPGGADVPVADGGTGSSSAAGARTNLGVPILQGARLAMTTILAAGTRTDTVTWGTAFADGNYTVSLSYMQQTMATGLCSGVITAAPLAASISVRTLNSDNTGRTPTLHALALHD